MPESSPRWTDGAKIVQARERAGLSQRQLAALVGTTAATVSHIETGKCEASVRMISLVADALGVDRGPFIRSANDALVAGELLARAAELREARFPSVGAA